MAWFSIVLVGLVGGVFDGATDTVSVADAAVVYVSRSNAVADNFLGMPGDICTARVSGS